MSAVPDVEQPAVPSCPHCGTLVEQPGYCCGGCELAARIIEGAGAGSYYADRTHLPAKPLPSDVAWSSVPVRELDAGTASATLCIDGLRCASCVWVVERVLEATDGVTSAEVSYATGRARLVWKAEVADLPTLARRIEALGYRPRPVDAAGNADHDLLVRFGLAAFVAVNVMSLHAAVYTGWLSGMEPRYLALFRWLSLALATPAVLWCAQPFFQGALTGVRHRLLHMDLPVSLAIAVMYGHAVVMTLTGGETWLDSATMLVALLLGGRVLEARGRRQAAEAAAALAMAVPRFARRLNDGHITQVDAAQLQPGDAILASSGEEVAADGIVTDGGAQLRMALLTGEAEPVPVGPGQRVVAGALVLDGHLTIEVQRTGDDTMVRQMAAAVLDSTSARVSTPTDAIAPWFTGVTLALALGSGVAWAWFGGASLGVERAVAVLVIACPCALALSWPLAASAGIGAAARRGLMLRSGDALLALADVQTVLLDKTGTLTEGELTVSSATDEVLTLAAGLERASVHPIARAITAEAAARGIPLPEPSLVHELPGRGIRGVVRGRRVRLQAGDPGQVDLYEGPHRLGSIHLADRLRPDAARAVQQLGAMHIDVRIVSGDRAEVARDFAHQAGVRHADGGVRPLDKVAHVRMAQAHGAVLFVGDGVNDAPALSAADVGIAMHHGAMSSVLVADGLLVDGTLGPLVSGIRAARAAKHAIGANIRRSVGYNIVATAIAVLGLVNPLVAAVTMPLSSLWVLWGSTAVERDLQKPTP